LSHCKQLLQEANTRMLKELKTNPAGINLRWAFSPPTGPDAGKWYLYHVKPRTKANLEVWLYPVQFSTSKSLQYTKMMVDNVATFSTSGKTQYICHVYWTSGHGNVTDLRQSMSEPLCIASLNSDCALFLNGTRVQISTPLTHLLNLECFIRKTLTAHARQQSRMPQYKQHRSDSDLRTAGGHPAITRQSVSHRT